MKQAILFILFHLVFIFFVALASFAQDRDTLHNTVLQLGLDKMNKVDAGEKFITQTTTITSKVEEKISDAPGIVEVVNKNEIQAFGGNTLSDVLNRLTNFYMASPSHLFNNQTSMRGDLTTTYSSHVLLLLNGRPMRESLFGGIDMAFINTIAIESIERIELIRGPGSVLYGTGAFTAVINIVMKNTKDTKTNISTRYGTNGTKGLNISQSYNKEDFTLQTSIRYYGQSANGSTYKDIDSVSRILPNENQNIGTYLSAEWKKFHIRGYYGITSATVMNNEQEWSRNFGEHNHTISERGFLDIGYRHTFSKSWNMTINNTINTHIIQFSFYDDYKMKMNTLDNLTEMTHFIKPNKNMNLTLGALLNINNNTDAGSLNSNFVPVYLIDQQAKFENNYALYGQLDYKFFKRLKLIAGLQMNKTSNVSVDYAPRLGAVLNLPFGIGIKALYGKAFRRFSHFEEGYQGIEYSKNKNLRPETVETTDIQVFIERPKWQFGLTYYNSHQKDVIGREILQNEYYTFSNQKNIIFQGIEAEGKYAISQNWFLMGNFSYYESVNNEGEVYTSAVPAITTCAGLAYYSQNKALNIGFYNVYFSKPPDVNELQKGKLPDGSSAPQRALVNPIPQAFDMISFNIALDITTAFRIKDIPKTTVSMYGENLLDIEVWQPEFFRRKINSIPYQSIGGRAFYLKVGIRF